MTLEKYLPEQTQPKKPFLQRIFNRGLASPEPRKRIDFEFFNADRTKKFEFYEFQTKEGETYQLNVSLMYSVGIGWVKKMQVMTKWENGSQYYEIELDAVSEKVGKSVTYFYNKETGGQKKLSGINAGRPIDLTYIATNSRLEQLGIIKEANLPEFIDYEKSALAFLQQAKNLDFETEPVLYPKELIVSEQPKALPATQ